MTNDYSYIEIGNADITGELNPSISAKSTYNLDVGININTLNAGHIVLNAVQGNVYVNATNLVLSNNLVVKNLDWKSLAKKSGIEKGDIISNFKIENLERPNKAVIYPFAAFLLFIFGLLNYRRSEH